MLLDQLPPAIGDHFTIHDPQGLDQDLVIIRRLLTIIKRLQQLAVAPRRPTYNRQPDTAPQPALNTDHAPLRRRQPPPCNVVGELLLGFDPFRYTACNHRCLLHDLRELFKKHCRNYPASPAEWTWALTNWMQRLLQTFKELYWAPNTLQIAQKVVHECAPAPEAKTPHGRQAPQESTTESVLNPIHTALKGT